MEDKYDKLGAELDEATAPAKKSKLREHLGIILFAGLGVGLMLLFNLAYGFETVKGNSMNDTYQDGDFVLIKKNADISYGDVVILDLRDYDTIGSEFIKRVIGKEGDVIDINFETGEVKRNGEVLDEPYIKELTLTDELGHEYPVTVPDGCYFVMGDNRNDSLDSRSDRVGFVPEKYVKGKVVKRLPKFFAKLFG